MEAASDKKVPVIIVFNDDNVIIRCNSRITLAQVRALWQVELGDTPSVSFFTADGRWLPEDVTVAEAQQNSGTVSMELHAQLNTAFWIELFGFEKSKTLFEAPSSVSPSVVHRQMVRALGVLREDFRLTRGKDVVDQKKSFEAQAISDGDLLTVDPKVQVVLRSESNEEQLTMKFFVAETISDLRQRFHLAEDHVIVATMPHRRLLSDSVRLCDVVSDKPQLDHPIELLYERKVKLFFQPLGQDRLRQEMTVSLSTILLDLYDELGERFEATNELRFLVNSLPLKHDTPLIEQNVVPGMVIQMDIARSHITTNLRADVQADQLQEMINFPSAESDLNDDRQLSLDGVKVKDQAAVLQDDVKRNVPFLFDEIEYKWGRVANLVGTAASLQQPRIYKELMRHKRLAAHQDLLRELRLTEETLITVNPLKVIVKLENRLRFFRLSRGSTLSDIRTHVEQTLGLYHLRLQSNNNDSVIREHFDLDKILLEGLSEFQTQLEVMVNDKSFQSCFESPEVSFTDVMTNVAKQMEISPRQLFQRPLYCAGCGRKISKDEDTFQKIPAPCCRVRSLKLTDRRCKDKGIQTAIPRSRSVETETLYPEERDAAVNTDFQRKRIITSAYTENERMACSTDEMMPRSFRVVAISPLNDLEETTVTIKRGHCAEIPSAVQAQMKRVRVGETPLMFWNEVTYEQYGEKQLAVQCYDAKKKSRVFINLKNGSVPENDNFIRQARRFLPLDSKPPPAPRLMPYLFLYTEPELFRVGRDRKLTPTLLTAVNDPSMLAMVMGLKSEDRLLVELSTGKFVEIERIGFASLLNEFFKDNTRRRIVILMADGDPVPRATLSKKDVIFVFRREGVSLRVRKGYVRCEEPRPTYKNLALWDAPLKSGIFDNEFTVAARK